MNHLLQSFKDQLSENRKAQLRRDNITWIVLGTGFIICAIKGPTRTGAIALGIGFALGSLHSLVFWAVSS